MAVSVVLLLPVGVGSFCYCGMTVCYLRDSALKAVESRQSSFVYQCTLSFLLPRARRQLCVCGAELPL